MITQKQELFDRVFDAQKSFMCLMQAFTFPGRLSALEPRSFLMDLDRTYVFAGSIISTLCDNETRLGFSPAVDETQAETLLRISSARGGEKESMQFCLFLGSSYDSSILELKRGTLEYPESSATAIILVERLFPEVTDGADIVVDVSGPGVNGNCRFCVEGLDVRYIKDREELNDVYPMGIDYLLCDRDGMVCGLPRTAVCSIVGER
ncbi:MAG: phosphonate C-P lyase system protein PhnH [Spirochaetales bacterium]|nr:phosphonate C-P lyase system protein PhnH [Spirochaetales bacterium]